MTEPDTNAVERTDDYQPASTRTLVLSFTFVGFVLALLVYMAVTNMPEQSADEWVNNAAVVEVGLEGIYVEDVTVIRDVRSTGRTTSRDETILVDGQQVDCKVFDDDSLDLRCKTNDGILPLTPEP